MSRPYKSGKFSDGCNLQYFTMEEFAEPVPTKVAYCPRISPSDFEAQSRAATAAALADLVQQIKRSPKTYTAILEQKRLDEYEDSALGYLSSKVLSFWGVRPIEVWFHLPILFPLLTSWSQPLSEEEKTEQVQKLVHDMGQVFAYSHGLLAF